MPNLLHSGAEESRQVSGKHEQRRRYGYIILLTVLPCSSRSCDKRTMTMISFDYSKSKQRHVHLEVISAHALFSRPVLRMAEVVSINASEFSGEGLNYRDSTQIFSSTFSGSHRYVSGNSRMLLVLVRVFQSRRGEVLVLFAKSKNDKRINC